MKTPINPGIRLLKPATAMLGAMLLGSQADAASLSIDVGTRYLTGNSLALQYVDLFVANSGADQRVGSFDLFVQLGNGGGISPSIASVDLVTDTLFSGNSSGVLSDTSNPQSVYFGVVKGAGAIGSGPLIGSTPTRVARVWIDTAGYAEGVLAFNIFGTSLGDTSFYTDEAIPELVELGLSNGFLNISSVPEPASMAISVGLGLLGVAIWRRCRAS